MIWAFLHIAGLVTQTQINWVKLNRLVEVEPWGAFQQLIIIRQCLFSKIIWKKKKIHIGRLQNIFNWLTWGWCSLMWNDFWCFFTHIKVGCFWCGRWFWFRSLQHWFLLNSYGPVNWLQTDGQYSMWILSLKHTSHLNKNMHPNKDIAYSFYRIIQGLPVMEWNCNAGSSPKVIVFSFGFITQNVFGFLQLLEICHLKIQKWNWNNHSLRCHMFTKCENVPFSFHAVVSRSTFTLIALKWLKKAYFVGYISNTQRVGKSH